MNFLDENWDYQITEKTIISGWFEVFKQIPQEVTQKVDELYSDELRKFYNLGKQLL
jgi:hypothetical protein